jgi:hypothetical protein
MNYLRENPHNNKRIIEHVDLSSLRKDEYKLRTRFQILQHHLKSVYEVYSRKNNTNKNNPLNDCINRYLYKLLILPLKLSEELLVALLNFVKKGNGSFNNKLRKNKTLLKKMFQGLGVNNNKTGINGTRPDDPSPPRKQNNKKPKEVEIYNTVNVKGDGSCLFRSIVLGRALLEGNNNKKIKMKNINSNLQTNEAQVLRKQVVDLLCGPNKNKHRKELNTAKYTLQHVYEIKDWDEYCIKMKENNCWGGSIELTLIPEIIKRPVYVFEEAKNNSTSGFVRILTFGDEFKREPIRILSIDNKHFKVLTIKTIYIKVRDSLIKKINGFLGDFAIDEKTIVYYLDKHLSPNLKNYMNKMGNIPNTPNFKLKYNEIIKLTLTDLRDFIWDKILTSKGWTENIRKSNNAKVVLNIPKRTFMQNVEPKINQYRINNSSKLNKNFINTIKIPAPPQ